MRDWCSGWGHCFPDQTCEAPRLLNSNVLLDDKSHLRFHISLKKGENHCFAGVAPMEHGAHAVVLAERGLVGLRHGCAQGLLVCCAHACLVAQTVFSDAALLTFSGAKMVQSAAAALNGSSMFPHGVL